MAILCDTHVHCYQFSEFGELLDCAWRNFSRHSTNLEDDQFVLFFTDGNSDKTWHALNASIKSDSRQGEWSITPFDEGRMLLAEQPSKSKKILIAPGRQINSAERLEFLLLGCEEDLSDGTPAAAILQQHSDNFLVICPWGVGKWLSQRGKILHTLLNQHGDGFFLGDNGGRPWFWGAKSHFTASKHQVLNGSDPLPISGELSRVADFGVRLIGPQQVTSLSQLIAQLKSNTELKENFGRPMGLWQFVMKRIHMMRR